MRVGRRGIILILATSLPVAVGLFVAAWFGRAGALRSGRPLHAGIEVLLWMGATAASLILAWALRRFRNEVHIEKTQQARREVREEYLREIRDYELTRSGPGGRWNN